MLRNLKISLAYFAEADQVMLALSFAKANKAIQGCRAKAYLPWILFIIHAQLLDTVLVNSEFISLATWAKLSNMTES